MFLFEDVLDTLYMGPLSEAPRYACVKIWICKGCVIEAPRDSHSQGHVQQEGGCCRGLPMRSKPEANEIEAP